MEFPRVSSDQQLSDIQSGSGQQQNRSQIGNYIEAFTDYLLAYNDSIKLLLNGQPPPDKSATLLRRSASYHPALPEQNNATTSIDSNIVLSKDNGGRVDEEKNVKKHGSRYKVKGPKQALHTLGKGSSKYRGVSWHKDNQRWRATIFKGNKPVHIGYFEKEVDAAHAYDREALKVRASNAILNFPAIEYPDILVDLHRSGRMLLDEATQKQCNNLLQASQEKGNVKVSEDGIPQLEASSPNDASLTLLPFHHYNQLLSLPATPFSAQFQPASSCFTQETAGFDQNPGSWMRKKMRRSYTIGHSVD